MESLVKIESKYGDGIMVEEYNGDWFLVSAYESKTGETVKRWCYPQRDKAPVEKAMPWKIKIGSSQEEAAKVMAQLYHAVKPKNQ